ncbi:cyclophilin-type peptidyl-prolyl cis-trans isomerase [Dunaliella salina]|uniref:Cyclophilin-type peptidyl-prolyl cis-trans isomerase n=1 Tax=Dunaliella salina TaxID=3046 RepID=A0ABQ7G4R2_DUNSA|nr:cyclophilin-type peptidyl-prolyl cis-trans isomerase [Dunaliella salina]|eukprot:KAF5829595.1 cyclophilin-type peptidyl-prolyl cis-trans isomerase [Dunaliella salina]
MQKHCSHTLQSINKLDMQLPLHQRASTQSSKSPTAAHYKACPGRRTSCKVSAPSLLCTASLRQHQESPSWPKSPAVSLSKTIAKGAAALALAASLLSAPSADAVLSAPNARIARTADAALRRSIPAINEEVRDIQRNLEDTTYLLRIPQRKPYGSMAKDVSAALSHFTPEERPKLLEGVPEKDKPEADYLVTSLYNTLKQVELAVSTQQPDFVGVRANAALQLTARLELLQSPGLPFVIPKEYANLPRLAGRSVVEFQVEQKDGELAFVDPIKGGLTSTGIIQVTADGYAAPISAGNFVANVLDGSYNGRVLEEGPVTITVPTPPTIQHPPIPLEVFPIGEYAPLYRLPLDIQGGELPVLPLSIPGSVSFAHIPDNDSYLSGDSFFMYRFSKQQAGLGGMAFDEGTFGVFGYVTKGLDVMYSLRDGAVITKTC